MMRIVCLVSKCSSNLTETRLTAVYSDPCARNVHADENHALFLLRKKIFDEALKLYILVRIWLWEKRYCHLTPWR